MGLMPLHRWFLPLLILTSVVLAGCTAPDEAKATQPPAGAPPAGGSPPTTGGTSYNGSAAFVVEGPVITPLDGRERSLREDDGALIRYTIRQPSEAATGAAALVSYILNGTVTDVENVQLAPGQTKTYERKVDEVRGMKELRVEVRAGSALGKATSPILAWPRLQEPLSFEPHFTVRVENWTRDEVQGATFATVTFQRSLQAFSEFRAHLLCEDAGGAVKPQGVMRPELQPQPNHVETIELRLPLCPASATTYGVDFKADLDAGKTVYGRVLFVPHGHVPPAAAGADGSGASRPS